MATFEIVFTKGTSHLSSLSITGDTMAWTDDGQIYYITEVGKVVWTAPTSDVVSIRKRMP